MMVKVETKVRFLAMLAIVGCLVVLVAKEWCSMNTSCSNAWLFYNLQNGITDSVPVSFKYLLNLGSKVVKKTLLADMATQMKYEALKNAFWLINIQSRYYVGTMFVSLFLLL